jgi:hypothetical protein
MSVCDTCPKPGNCCQDFPLHSLDPERKLTKLEIMIELASLIYANPDRTRPFIGLPFIPARYDPTAGHGTGSWRFNCVNLLPDGRCGDYDNRPYGPCVLYQPREDALCVLFEVS